MRNSRTMLGTAAVIIFATLGMVPSVVRGADGVTKIRFTTTFNSIATTLNTLPDGHVYGWNHYLGTTRWAGQEATVDFLGSVNYVNGSGRFDGYVTLTRADGVILAFRVDGDALPTETWQGARTELSGRLEVIQGTDEFAGATGIGVTTGFRNGELGTQATFTFTLTVTRK
jgi:hypothetical protein